MDTTVGPFWWWLISSRQHPKTMTAWRRNETSRRLYLDLTELGGRAALSKGWLT